MKTVVLSEPHLWESVIRVGGHHYARSFLDAGWRVVFVSQPLNVFRLARGGTGEAGRIWREGGAAFEGGRLINYVPAFLVPLGRSLPRPVRRNLHRLGLPRLRRVLARHGIHRADLLWINGAVDAWMLDEVPHDRSFLRVVDDYAGYKEYPEYLVEGLNRAVREATVVACASEPVRRRLAESRPDVHLVRNGVLYEHFARDDLPEPADLRDLPRPRILYVGALSYWFDWDLLASIASSRPGYSFVVIGPGGDVMSPDIRAALPPNVHLLGGRGYDDLPAYLAHSDVGMIPFQQTRLVNGVSPIKAYEYLAAGLPVVATRWEEIEASGVPARLVDSPGEWLTALDAAVSDGATARQSNRAYARMNTWQARFERVMELCGESAPGLRTEVA